MIECSKCIHNAVCDREAMYGWVECPHYKHADDVAEVRHGKVIQLDHDEWWGAVYQCCECNGMFMLGDRKRATCCPYCGAYLSVKGDGDELLGEKETDQ